MSPRSAELLNSVFEALAHASSEPLIAFNRQEILFVNSAFKSLSESALKIKAEPGLSPTAVMPPPLLEFCSRVLEGQPGDTFIQLSWEKEAACFRVTFSPLIHPEGVVAICSWRELAHSCGEEFTCGRLVEQAETLRIDAESALRALQESEEKFRVVAENARAVFGIVQGAHFVYANPYLSQLSGYTNQEILSMHIADLIHPDCRAQVLEFAIKRQAGESVPQHYEFAMITKSGETRWLDFTPARINYNGAPAIVGTAFDITDRKRAQELLIKTEKLASVGRMAATIAHEINNPLAAVMNCLFLARNASDNESLKRFLDTADEELRRIALITQQALGFYREPSSPTPLSVAEVMESAIGLLKSKIKSKHVSIDKEYLGNTSAVAIAGELRQVFANLLSNSLEAVDDRGSVRVRVCEHHSVGDDSRFVRITVSDNGKGIPNDVRPHIFEPLFTTRVGVGTGLGLWVSREIVEKHHGSIRVHSSPSGLKRGTTFSVSLPTT